MAPVLFLFLMSLRGLADSLEAIWESMGLEKMQSFARQKRTSKMELALSVGHTPKQYQSSKLDILTVFQCLYIDDGALPCNSSKGTASPRMQSYYDHFARFGLEMHIGRTVNGKETASNTECVSFLDHPSSARRRTRPHSPTSRSTDSLSKVCLLLRMRLLRYTSLCGESGERPPWSGPRRKLSLSRLVISALTKPNQLRSRMASSPSPCTGSFISYNLRDDFDINLRIKKAGQAMGALKHFFNNKHIDTYLQSPSTLSS
ncbi:hypothetical protein THAOC_26666 [Thalassiosira oceanica]|uniref:PiggyBac transposable element-derived protein domain-containing protein n=1 Tax=Thalassiosira oceanica TaxID=159749 RepID=K0S4J7_THAOC|nr:hypothetical protein THAOC_26666 [Thalassiosira oceanica]|eukprot:EJK53817.1 hypothetical protein THAOC_26666 [Thalassiosira oceanica]